MRQHYAKRRELGAPVLESSVNLIPQLLSTLPFGLTNAQQRVVQEISQDLARPYPMQRLLQGDVGSGKTIVAMLAALQAIENGYQVAIMAPTEILAEQHYQKMLHWLAPLEIQIAWLSGSQNKKDRAASLDAIISGAARLVVGTHALIQAQVQFNHLGFVVVDEQHRLGRAAAFTPPKRAK